MMKQHYHALILAFQFLTRIPVYRVFAIANTVPSEQVAGKALLYYPVVGLVIGGWLLILPWLLLQFNVPMSPAMQAGLVLVLWVWITGALHLDGLADSADAWLGGFGDKQRTLDLMKDPTCGPAAVVVLVLVLLLKWLALTQVITLLQGGPHWLWWGLLLVPVLARVQAMLLVVHTPYVRAQGLGSQLKNHAQAIWIWVWLLVCILLALYLNGGLMLSMVLVMAAGGWLMRRMMLQRLDGWTGDTAGASIEVAELLALIVLSLSI
ncbi:MAG: adenosylcobinamide-GDP ribazoletransferase [Gammaproteobacteria bacterium]|nr:adenosylcobinamide-GDP ribazoletransferase [Gammaproteobacteria bacterium]